MSGTFTARIDELIRAVEGKWEAKIEVNQVYAHYQEVHPEFHHPDGGQAFYLRDTIYAGLWMPMLAHNLITEFGVALEPGLRQVAEGMAKGVYIRAPWEFNDLRRSGHPKVTRHGAVIWDRSPDVARQSPSQLRMKKQISYLLDPNRYGVRRFR